MRKTPALVLCFVCCAPGLAALDTRGFQNNQSFHLNCDDRHEGSGRIKTCEVREQTLPVSGSLNVDASPNGGVAVKGWDQSKILVRARVEAWAVSESEAQSIAREVQQIAAGGQIRSTGPRNHDESGWSVSYEIFVPHLIDVDATTVNGGVSVTDVGGRLRINTTNGGLNLTRVSGEVEARTVNGGVSVTLMGDHWDGAGLDAESNNGGVSVSVPAGYSARLQGSTVNGGLSSSFGDSAISHGRNHSIDTVVGNGGATVKVTTVNGGLSFKQVN